MVPSRFLQVHTLHSYPAALLNRDDSGLAKRMPFGGAMRTRISSQCLKWHWRSTQDAFALSAIVPDAIRSRNVIDREVIKPLEQTGDISAEVLVAVRDAFNVGLYGGSGTSQTGRQPLLLGLPEVEYLRDKAAAICVEHAADAKAAGQAAARLFSNRRGEGANLAAFRDSATLPGGLVGALFGRMITSAPLPTSRPPFTSRTPLPCTGRRARAIISPSWTTCGETTRALAPPISVTRN